MSAAFESATMVIKTLVIDLFCFLFTSGWYVRNNLNVRKGLFCRAFLEASFELEFHRCFSVTPRKSVMAMHGISRNYDELLSA